MSSNEQSTRTAVVIDDDPEVGRMLSDVLESAGFRTVIAINGLDGLTAVDLHSPLITTVDVTLPGIDGFETTRRIRARSDTYIVMITALGEEADVVLGLASGADEFVTKPFRPRELRARIEALLRRPRHTGSADAGEADEQADPWLAHRGIRLDASSRIASVDGVELILTRSEFDLLESLMRSGRRVRSKTDLTLALRGSGYHAESSVDEADKRAIEAHMTNLRRKLGDDPTGPRFIETVRGVGYRLTLDPAVS